MGQTGSKGRDLYVQMLRDMLKTRGSKVKLLQLTVFRLCVEYVPLVPRGRDSEFRNLAKDRRKTQEPLNTDLHVHHVEPDLGLFRPSPCS
jgi:hypothetical protein